MSSSIVTTFREPGFHMFQDAPPEVDFLSDLHRHLFTFKVYCQVLHANRDLEFFIVQNKVKLWLKSEFIDRSNRLHRDWPVGLFFYGMSCEMIAERILERFRTEFNVYKVEVWEDDENGAVVELNQNGTV